MGILQALFGLITKSAGKILNAIFGWAVHALFGQTTPRDQTLLSALVGAAVAWPLLAAGVAAPKVAALALAFIPIPHAVPSWAIRLAWLFLALVVPLALGFTLAHRRPPHAPSESPAVRLLRGFPLTLGLALAFLILFVSVPLMRLWAVLRREKSIDIPLVTDAQTYHEVAARIVETLNRHDFKLRAAEPSWWVKAPTRILGFFGGDAFSAFVPKKIEHYASPVLQLSFYTSGVMLRGRAGVSKAHGLISETAIGSQALETFSGEAQELEKQIRRLCRIYDKAPDAHEDSARLLARIDDLMLDLSHLDLDYDEWQVLYRQLLQAERAIRGRRPLMDGVLTAKEGNAKEGPQMNTNESVNVPVASSGSKDLSEKSLAASLPTADLLKEIVTHAEQLARTQFDLAKAELRADLLKERGMVTGLGIGAIGALVSVTLLLMTAILALALIMPAWEAGLAVSGLVVLVAGVAGWLGWIKRVRTPLAHTRHELQEDMKWTKERIA
jgi:uncharacterized membrane protein YqjE